MRYEVARRFETKISGDKKAIFNRILQMAEANNITVNGDENSGTFSGLVTGSYFVTGDNVSITIIRKPLFVSWDYVEGLIQKGL